MMRKPFQQCIKRKIGRGNIINFWELIMGVLGADSWEFIILSSLLR